MTSWIDCISQSSLYFFLFEAETPNFIANLECAYNCLCLEELWVDTDHFVFEGTVTDFK